MKKIFIIISWILVISTIIFIPLTFNKYIDVSSFIDFIVFIDPGHGGKDNGATYLDIYEDEINLSISKKLYEKCISKNLIAYISRTDDYDLASLYAKNRKNEDLSKRAENINHSGCDVFISIHVNKYQTNDVNGPMVYYDKNNEYSYLLSKNIQKELNILSNKNKTVHHEDFYLFKNCTKPGVIVECGFISNEEERSKLIDDKYQQAIVDALYQGIYNYYLNN